MRTLFPPTICCLGYCKPELTPLYLTVLNAFFFHIFFLLLFEPINSYGIHIHLQQRLAPQHRYKLGEEMDISALLGPLWDLSVCSEEGFSLARFAGSH